MSLFPFCEAAGGWGGLDLGVMVNVLVWLLSMLLCC